VLIAGIAHNSDKFYGHLQVEDEVVKALFLYAIVQPNWKQTKENSDIINFISSSSSIFVFD